MSFRSNHYPEAIQGRQAVIGVYEPLIMPDARLEAGDRAAGGARGVMERGGPALRPIKRRLAVTVN